MKFLLVSILHHSEPVDPELMTWVLNMFKQIFNLSPWHFAIIVAFVVLAFSARDDPESFQTSDIFAALNIFLSLRAALTACLK